MTICKNLLQLPRKVLFGPTWKTRRVKRQLSNSEVVVVVVVVAVAVAVVAVVVVVCCL